MAASISGAKKAIRHQRETVIRIATSTTASFHSIRVVYAVLISCEVYIGHGPNSPPQLNAASGLGPGYRVLQIILQCPRLHTAIFVDAFIVILSGP